jgi:glucose-1-phosphate thymidylyltransferase
VVTRDESAVTARRISRDVVLARVLGTRMRHGDAAAALDRAGLDGRRRPQVLMPVGRPFLDYVIASLADAGIDDVCLVIGAEHQVTRPLRARLPARRVRVHYAVQDAPLGTAHAVLAAADFIGDHDILVVNGDNLYPAALEAVCAPPPRWRPSAPRP